MTLWAPTTAGGGEVQLELSIAAEIACVVKRDLKKKSTLLMIELAFMP